MSLISVEVDSYLLSHYKIETLLIYYEIHHCLPIVMGYSWRVMVEGTFLLINWFLIFSFTYDKQLFIYLFSFFSFLIFFWHARLILDFICLSFGLWRVQRKAWLIRIGLALNIDNFLVYWLQFIIHNPIIFYK